MIKQNKQVSIELENHVCKTCGCTENTPRHNKDYGYCWWINRDKTVCSHCFHHLPLSKPYQLDKGN